jgi:hypothetical protein
MWEIIVIVGVIGTFWFLWSLLYWRIEVEKSKEKIKAANNAFQKLSAITDEWSSFTTDISQIEKYESLKNNLFYYSLIDVTKDLPLWEVMILKSWILIANIVCLIALGLILLKMIS